MSRLDRTKRGRTRGDSDECTNDVMPFREEAQAKLGQLSDTSETLETLAQSSVGMVFPRVGLTGGDIAKQMPVEAKKFQKINYDWAKSCQRPWTRETSSKVVRMTFSAREIQTQSSRQVKARVH